MELGEHDLYSGQPSLRFDVYRNPAPVIVDLD
jgi:hypothetical protein